MNKRIKKKKSQELAEAAKLLRYNLGNAVIDTILAGYFPKRYGVRPAEATAIRKVASAGLLEFGLCGWSFFLDEDDWNSVTEPHSSTLLLDDFFFDHDDDGFEGDYEIDPLKLLCNAEHIEEISTYAAGRAFMAEMIWRGFDVPFISRNFLFQWS